MQLLGDESNSFEVLWPIFLLFPMKVAWSYVDISWVKSFSLVPLGHYVKFSWPTI